jgi:hypothetical protein
MADFDPPRAPGVRNVSDEPRITADPAPRGSRISRISVMDWLLGVGGVVARRLRGVPRAPMVNLHPRR